MLYFQIVKFSFMRYLAYPFEIIIALIRMIVEISFLIFFWSLYAKVSHNQTTIQSLASYFLIASGVSSIVMAQWGEFGGSIGRYIKMGLMSNYFLKPFNTLIYFHALAIGKEGVDHFMAITSILIGLVIQPPASVTSIVLFILFFIVAYITSMSINVIIGTIYFHSAESNGILNAMNHIIGVLSGVLVPIYLFPHPYDYLIKLTPFPTMVFGPVNALKTTTITSDVLLDFTVGVFWSVALTFLAYAFWNKSTKKYEAIGI